MLQAVIRRDGSVGETTIVKSNALFNEAAIAAVKQWKYKPTIIDGQPVEVVLTITVPFVLK